MQKQSPAIRENIADIRKERFKDNASTGVLLFLFLILKDRELAEVSHHFKAYLQDQIAQEKVGVLSDGYLDFATHYDLLNLCREFILDFTSKASPVSALHSSSAINAAHSGKVPDDVVDFSHSEESWGIVFDSTGHNKPRTAAKVEAFDELVKNIRNVVSDGQLFSKEQLAQAVANTGKFFEVKGLDGAVSFASIVEVNSQKYALSFSIKDSQTIIAHADGNVTIVDSPKKDKGEEYLQVGPKQLAERMRFIPVKDGDLIIGVTDGIGDFIGTPEIVKHAKETSSAKHAEESSDDASEFLERCKATIQSDPSREKKYDDLSAFILVV